MICEFSDGFGYHTGSINDSLFKKNSGPAPEAFFNGDFFRGFYGNPVTPEYQESFQSPPP